jgi:hypothetical protein
VVVRDGAMMSTSTEFRMWLSIAFFGLPKSILRLKRCSGTSLQVTWSLAYMVLLDSWLNYMHLQHFPKQALIYVSIYVFQPFWERNFQVMFQGVSQSLLPSWSSNRSAIVSKIIDSSKNRTWNRVAPTHCR